MRLRARVPCSQKVTLAQPNSRRAVICSVCTTPFSLRPPPPSPGSCTVLEGRAHNTQHARTSCVHCMHVPVQPNTDTRLTRRATAHTHKHNTQHTTHAHVQIHTLRTHACGRALRRLVTSSRGAAMAQWRVACDKPRVFGVGPRCHGSVAALSPRMCLLCATIFMFAMCVLGHCVVVDFCHVCACAWCQQMCLRLELSF